MMIENCRRIEDATDLDVERFLEHKASRGINSKCFIACVFEHLGIVSIFFSSCVISFTNVI